MPQIKMEYEISVDDHMAQIFERSNERMRNMLMVGAILSDMSTKDALQTMFASLGTICDERHLNKGKILYEWSKEFDILDEKGF